MPGVAPAFARSAARWTRAYPRGWRLRRGHELVAVLADLAGPDATRVDVRTGLGLLRSGLVTRHRSGPPWPSRVGYLLLDTTLSDRYATWVVDDLTSPRYRMWRAVRSSWPAVLPTAILATGDAPAALRLLGLLVVVQAVALLASHPETVRRRAVRRHLVPGPPVVGPRGEQVVLGRTRRLAALPVLRGCLALAATGAVAWSAAALLAPVTWSTTACPADGAVVTCTDVGTAPRGPDVSAVVVAVLAVALVVGLVLAAVARRALRRGLPSLPGQPGREVVPPVPTAVTGWVAAALGVVAAAAAEAVGTWTLSLSVLAGPACLVLLTVGAVTLAAVRDDATVAFVDVVRLLAGRDVAVDEGEPALAVPSA
ncbi:hypothetical protein [Cellulomonas fimi]|uniref:hypothetical protein n=1 Tax=Cellulomonas fimi TaxID=1708 RepID=UPI000F81D8EE|nr:hypothetical protein [Cellulomonas fimi]NNH05835.1 hypothetical protein [Cellulomonas fimi]